MKYLFFSIIIIAISFSACTQNEKKNEAAQAETSKEIYTCPMHPSVISDHPGACPVCGMALVKKSSQRETSKEELTALQQVRLSPTQRVLANVETVPVEMLPIENMITAVGMADVAETHQATVSARFRGRIEKLFVNFNGDFVKKGQPLFELYSPDLITSQQEFILALDGKQQSLISGMRERLQLNFGMTDNQIASLEQQRKVQTSIIFYSPISGTVVLKQVQAGEYVDEGTVLYQLADLSIVWINLDVYEKDIPYIKKGEYVHIQTEAYPEKEFTGKVTFVSPVINPDTRTVQVRTEFDNRHGMLKPKMFVTATIYAEGKRTLAVPLSAVLFTGKRSVVWVETAVNTFEPRNVTLGNATDTYYEVLDGLQEGDMIAVSGGFLIDSESSLQHPEQSSEKNTPALPSHEVHATAASPSAKPAVVKITVDGSYSPDVVHVKLGQPVQLQFHRIEDSQCTEEIIFEELNLRKKLPAFKTTTITLTPKELGEISFSCGMSMVHGKLIVDR